MTAPIGFVLTLDGERQVTSGMQRVGASMQRAEGAAASLKSAMGGLAGTFAGAISVREFVQAADAVTNLQNKLALATGGAQAAATAYSELFRIAQQSRTGFVELGETFASISTAAGDLGVSQGRLLKVTEAIGNAVTVSGASAQAAQAALMQLGQGLASGTLRGEELNSVMEQTPRLAKAIADGMGKTRAELRELGSQGQITAKAVIEALESQAATLAREVEGAVKTVGQAYTQLKNSATVAAGDFDKATGATQTLAGAMSSLAKSIDGVGRTVREHEDAFKILGGTIVGTTAAVSILAVAAALSKVGIAVSALGAALLANPAALVLLGLGAAAGGGIAAVSAYNKTERGTREAIAALEEANKRSEAALARAEAGGRTAGADNIRNTIAGRNKTIAGLKGEIYVTESAGIDNRAEEARLARTTGAMADQKREADDLAATKRKLYGVDDNYLPTLTKLHAQFQAGKITLKEYQELVGKLAESNFKKPDGGGAAAAAKDTLGEQLEQFKQREKDLQNARKDTLSSFATDVKLGRMSELDQIDASFEAEEKAWAARKANFAEELALMARQKDSKTEQVRIVGEMKEADRDYAQAKTKYETDILLLNQRNVAALADRIEKEQAAARNTGEDLRQAQQQAAAVGLEGEALGRLQRADTEYQASQLRKLAIWADVIDKSGELGRAYRKQADDMLAAFDTRAATQSAAMVNEYSRSVKEAGESLEFELSVMGMNERQRAVAIEQRRIENDLIRRRKEIEAGTVDQPDERKRQLGDLEAAGIKDKANAENKVFLDEWNKTVNQYDDIFRNGFADMVNNGKEGWDSFTKSLATTFKTTVADAIYKQFIKPIVVNVVGSFMGISGGGGLTGAAGGGSNLMGMASNAYSLYNGASSAYTLGSQYLGGTMSGANALGSLYANATGAGLDGLLATNAAFGTSAQSAIAANLAMEAGTAPALAAGTNAAATSAGTAGLGTVGIVGLIVLGVINALGGMRSETQIGSGLAGTLGGGSALTPWQEWREGGTLFDGPMFSTNNPLEELSGRRAELQRLRDSGQGDSNYAISLQAIVTDLEKTTAGLAMATAVWDREITKGYNTYRDNVVDMANSLGLAGSSLEDFAYTLGAQDLNFQGLKPEEIQAKITETFGKAGTEMVQGILGSWREVTDTIVDTWVNTTDPHNPEFTTNTTVNTRQEYVPSAYAKEGETAIQTLTRLATSFNTLNEASDALGFGIHQGSLALADFADDFIEKFGGLGAFTTKTSAFLQAYYTDGERKTYLIDSAVRQAEKLGIKGLTAEGIKGSTREQFRDYVNTAASNPGLYKDALDLALYLDPVFAAFDSQAPVVQEVADTVDELTQAYQNAVKSLTGDRDTLAVDLLRAQGNETGAKALERQQYLAQFDGLDAVRLQEITTLYDTNEATRTLIASLEKQGETARTLAEELDALLDSWRSPQDRISAGYNTISADLSRAGINVAPDALAMASIDVIGSIAAEIYNLGTTSDETRLALVRAVGGLRTLKDQAVDLASSRVDAANAAFQREAQDRRTELQDTIADIRAVFDATSDAARNLLMDVDSTSSMLGQQGRAFIGNALDMARATGQLPDSQKLSDAIAAATGDVGKAVYATQFEADRDRLVLGNKLNALGDIAGDQLSVQELELKSLDDMVKAAQAQLDALNGIDTRVLGLDTRFVQLSSAILGLQGAKAAATPGGSRTITGAGGASFDGATGIGRNGDGATWNVADVRAAAEAALLAGQGAQVRDILAGSGWTMADVDKIFGFGSNATRDWLQAAGLQPFAQGINYVPYDMPAMVHKGETIIPAQFSPFNPGAAQPLALGGGHAALVAAIDRLELRMARIEANTAGTAANTAPLPQLGRQFDQVAGSGRVLTKAT